MKNEVKLTLSYFILTFFVDDPPMLVLDVVLGLAVGRVDDPLENDLVAVDVPLEPVALVLALVVEREPDLGAVTVVLHGALHVPEALRVLGRPAQAEDDPQEHRALPRTVVARDDVHPGVEI